MTTGDHDRPVTGDEVRAAREERRLTRGDLATQVGCSEGTIKLIERSGADPIIDSRFAPAIIGFLALRPAPGEVPLTPALIERALREADDIALMAETSRRLAYGRGARHDQGNVTPFEIRGMPESDSQGDGSNDPPA